MALLTFHGVSISGIAACVPSKRVKNDSLVDFFSEKELKKIIRSTGIKERRFAADGQCGSDFALCAAGKLLKSMQRQAAEIDILIYLTQTPDYMLIPPTSCILQERLGCPNSTAAFDINMNCSGFIYALSTAFAYASAGAKVLLLCGETLSRVFPATDKTTGLLFGDGGGAVLIEPDAAAADAYFSLNTNGKDYDAIKVEAGGYRHMASPETLELHEYPDGSRRTLHHGAMDGMRVFDFTQSAVLPDVRKVLEYAKIGKDEIDWYFFHQANKFMLGLFGMELGVDNEKIPISLDRFGNTSTVSIPLGISADFGGGLKDFGKVVMSGFGGGLSWGSAMLRLNKCFVCGLEEI